MMKYKIVDMEPKMFLGLKTSMPFTDERKELIPSFWEKATKAKYFNKLEKHMTGLGVVGITYNINYEDSICDYLVGIESDTETLDETDSLQASHTRFLQFEITGALPGSVRNIEFNIIKTIQEDDFYNILNGPIIEEYPEGDPYSEDYVTYLYVPVVENI